MATELFRLFHPHLPHVYEKDIIQTVTFRLQDALEDFVDLKKAELRILQGSCEEEARRLLVELERKRQLYLDRCRGRCILDNGRYARIVLDQILRENHRLYDAIAWCVMPNHVHLMMRMLTRDLAKCMRLMKRRSSFLINRELGTTGTRLWAHGYYDRYIRGDRHFEHSFDYIMGNAGRCGFNQEFTGYDQDWDRHGQPG